MDQQEAPKSFVQIIFDDIGSTNMIYQVIQATPMQVLALAEYLHFLGENGLIQERVKEAQKAQQNKIIVPGMDVPDLPK